MKKIVGFFVIAAIAAVNFVVIPTTSSAQGVQELLLEEQRVDCYGEYNNNGGTYTFVYCSDCKSVSGSSPANSSTCRN